MKKAIAFNNLPAMAFYFFSYFASLFRDLDTVTNSAENDYFINFPYHAPPAVVRIRSRTGIIRIPRTRTARGGIVPIPARFEAVLTTCNLNFFATASGQDYALRKGRLTPRPPLLAFVAEREAAALREREPHEEELHQSPPAWRQ